MGQDGAIEHTPGTFPLEKAGPLSRSRLWRLQRRYFEKAGMAAWSAGEVPSYVTSNAFIARAYARVVAAYARDWVGADTGRQALTETQPIYVIELGAGSGRFAFHFLKKFSEEEAWLPAGTGRVTYVMTEYNRALLDIWQEHPALAPFVAAGRLDFALFDAEQPADLILSRSRRTLAPGAVTGPVVLLANYFFDSVPQDAFYTEGGRLYESAAALTSTQAELDPDDPALLSRARLVYERRPISSRYYGEPELDGLLEEYRRELSDAGLAFPASGLRTVAYFDRLASGRLLLLSTDKGYHRPQDLHGRREPGFEVHGSFSMGVNYHAFGRYFLRHGGQALHLTHRHSYLNPCAFLLGDPPGAYRATQQAYAQTLAEFGPEEFYLLQSTLDQEHAPLSVEQILALLRLSGWDHRIFQTCFGDLLAGLATASDVARVELAMGTARLWDNYYSIGEEYDLAYDLGIVHYKLNDHGTALVYFLHSLAQHGRSAKTFYNMALCHYLLHDVPQALGCIAEAQTLDPAFEPAEAMRRRLQAELQTRG